ncbi:MAG: hypothetical protein EOO44_01280 [Flavobacterium sp.]|nr:MAG: hypothetical protein EOO44_01280 [Flavobacterium sp.]
MMKKLLKFLFVLLVSNSMFGQQNDTETNEKSNPIIYVDFFGGFSAMKHVGFSGGAELNYQSGKSLFSLRFVNATGYTRMDNLLIVVPYYYKSEENNEYSFLYGRRWLKENHSYSISTGISYNNFERAFRDPDENRFEYNSNFCGVPFEANYKWYYKKRRSNLVYNALIPSVGLKIFGNIGKYSYFGAGVSVGFGLSKYY